MRDRRREGEFPKRNSEFPILPGELKMRFGCGALFGLVTGFIGVAHWISHPTWLQLLGYMAVNTIVCGILARAFGNEFWRDTRPWW
jgi:hypothetical protein